MNFSTSSPRLVIHCGANKTGTTAVQVACYQGRDILKDMGILYPDLSTDNIPARSNFPLAVAFQEAPENYYVMKDYGVSATRARAYANHIKKIFLSQVATSGCDTVFISTEAIGLLDPSELEQMLTFFNTHFRQIDAVYYARSPVDSLLSFLQEYIKGGTVPNMTDIAASQHMLFGETAHKLKCQFGDLLHLRQFDRSALYNQDILSDVFHVLMGIDALPEGLGGQKTNASLTAPAAALLYFANLEVPRRLNGKTNPTFTQLRSIAANYSKNHSKGQKLTLPSDNWAAYIRKVLGPDFHLFLCHSGQTEKAADLAKQLVIDRQDYPTLKAPSKAEMDRWMLGNIKDFRFDLAPPEIAAAIKHGIQKARSLTSKPRS